MSCILVKNAKAVYSEFFDSQFHLADLHRMDTPSLSSLSTAPGSNFPFVSFPEIFINSALVSSAKIESEANFYEILNVRLHFNDDADTISREPPCCFCKERKQNCVEACIYYPFFPAEHLKEYTVVKTIFNIKNFMGLVGLVDPEDRMNARNNIVNAAIYRAFNPTYEPTSEISKYREILAGQPEGDANCG